jgi:DNA-binding MarR family transcriptional regulator
MTRIVNALEELGLVTKEKSSSDGRSIHLSATAGGRELLLAGRERRVRALAAQVESLTHLKKKYSQLQAKSCRRLSTACRWMRSEGDLYT